MAEFRWNEKKSLAAIALADGQSKAAVAREHAIPERTLYNWLNTPEFAEEVDRLTLMMGIAGKAERLRIAKRVVRQMVGENGDPIITGKDLLDWLKFAQSETDGIKLDLATLAEAAGSLADTGQD